MDTPNPAPGPQFTPFAKPPTETRVLLKTGTRTGVSLASKVMVSLGILGAAGGFAAALIGGEMQLLAEPTMYTLQITQTGEGGVVIVSNPSGINCGFGTGICSASFPAGTIVTLNPSYSGGLALLSSWSGGGCGGAGSCTVTMSGNTIVTSHIVPAYAVESNLVRGAGIVSFSPAAPCTYTCTQHIYLPDTTVTLTAVPAAGASFIGWQTSPGQPTEYQPCSGTNPTCTFTLDGVKSVYPTFTGYDLNVARAGSGSGTLTCRPIGYEVVEYGVPNFQECFNEYYAPGTSVTITATPAAGSIFTGWGGACSGSSMTCVVTMNSTLYATATFATAYYSLSVNKAGSGAGTVVSSPAGINCGTGLACSVGLLAGTTTTLTATPAADSAFIGWSSNCTPSPTVPNTCTVTMNSDTTITATFSIGYNLSVSKVGSGSVTSNPTGISCGSTCSASYAAGTNVTLAATVASGSKFTGWSGACSGTGVCRIIMSAAKSATANFALTSPPLPVAQ